MKSVIKVSPFSYLLLNKGFIRADKLEQSLEINSLGEKEKIKELTRVNTENAYWLTLQNGNSIIVSESNLICTLNGWIKISEIKEGDQIICKFYQEENKEGSKKIPWENKLETSALPITVPNNNSEEFSEWLGIIAGYATISEQSGLISIPSDNEKLIGRLNELTKIFFNTTFYKAKDNRGDRKTLNLLKSANLTRFLVTFIGPDFALRKVPNFILEGSTLEQESFVRGLTIENYKHKSELIVFSGVSKILSEFSQYVLRNQGYLVNLYMKSMPVENKKPYYYLSILGVTPFLKRKNIFNYDFIEGKKNYMVPFTSDLTKIKISYLHPNYQAFVKLKERNQKYARLEIVKNLELDHDVQMYVAQVRSNISIGEKTLVGIESSLSEEIVLNHLILA